MSQWANRNPERMEEIAKLPASEQQDALRAAIPAPPPPSLRGGPEGLKRYFVTAEATTHGGFRNYHVWAHSIAEATQLAVKESPGAGHIVVRLVPERKTAA